MLKRCSGVKLASFGALVGVLASAGEMLPAFAEIPANLPQQCRAEIQSSINNFRRGRSITVRTEVGEPSEGHPSDRPQAVKFAFEGRAARNVLASPQMLTATAQRVIQNCPTVSAVSFGAWRTGGGATIGMVNGNIQAFECYEAGEPYPGWGHEACGI